MRRNAHHLPAALAAIAAVLSLLAALAIPCLGCTAEAGCPLAHRAMPEMDHGCCDGSVVEAAMVCCTTTAAGERPAPAVQADFPGAVHAAQPLVPTEGVAEPPTPRNALRAPESVPRRAAPDGLYTLHAAFLI